MKKKIIILSIIFTTILGTGCNDKIETYSDSVNRLNFNYNLNSSDSVINYTFVYEPATQNIDTILVSVKTMGFVVNYNRALILEQVMTGENDAEAGKHYIAFNDSSISDQYFIPAGKAITSIPVYVKRDPSLKKESVKLQIRFAENEYFKSGYEPNRERVIMISDLLSKPISWTNNITNYMTGAYGTAKHQFMIDATGMRIDEEYFRSIVRPALDINYLKYLGNWFSNKLDEYNAGKDEQLKEADGTVVQFKKS